MNKSKQFLKIGLPLWMDAISLIPPWSQVVELDGGSFGIVKTLCAGEVALLGLPFWLLVEFEVAKDEVVPVLLDLISLPGKKLLVLPRNVTLFFEFDDSAEKWMENYSDSLGTNQKFNKKEIKSTTGVFSLSQLLFTDSVGK